MYFIKNLATLPGKKSRPVVNNSVNRLPALPALPRDKVIPRGHFVFPQGAFRQSFAVSAPSCARRVTADHADSRQGGAMFSSPDRLPTLVRELPTPKKVTKPASDKELQNTKPFIAEFSRYDGAEADAYMVMQAARRDQDGVLKQPWAWYFDTRSGQMKQRPDDSPATVLGKERGIFLGSHAAQRGIQKSKKYPGCVEFLARPLAYAELQMEFVKTVATHSTLPEGYDLRGFADAAEFKVRFPDGNAQLFLFPELDLDKLHLGSSASELETQLYEKWGGVCPHP